MDRTLCIETPAGPVTITATAQAVTAIRFGGTPDRAGTPGRLDSPAIPDNSDTPGAAASAFGTSTPNKPGYSAAIDLSGALVLSAPTDTTGAAAINSPGIPDRFGVLDTSDPAASGPVLPGDAAAVLLRQTADELTAYFAGERRDFTFGMAPAGTPFQQAVWAALQTIPYGQTRTYAQIAAQIGRPRACRAVGRANNRNPIAIAIPCHRVVGSTGALVGYAAGLTVKDRLLRLEAAH